MNEPELSAKTTRAVIETLKDILNRAGQNMTWVEKVCVYRDSIKTLIEILENLS